MENLPKYLSLPRIKIFNLTLDTLLCWLYIAAMMVTQKSPRKAPAVTIRFRTKGELEKIRRAARLDGLSMNTLVATAAVLEAHSRIAAAEERAKSQTV